MGTTANTQSAALLAELDDLLQLDRDAVQAYTLAEKGLKNDAFRSSIQRFRGDHERHVQELTRLIESRGGSATELPHLSSSPFKLAAQGLGNLGSDTTVLLAFKANERLSRDKYQRAANQGYPAEVHAVLMRGAEDESSHYAWVQQTLEQLGAGEDTTAGKTEKVVEAAHVTLADGMKGAEKRARHGAKDVWEKAAGALDRVSDRVSDVTRGLGRGGMRNVWIALGVGLVVSQLIGRTGGGSPSGTAARRTSRKPTTSRRVDSRLTESMPADARAGSRDWGEPALREARR